MPSPSSTICFCESRLGRESKSSSLFTLPQPGHQINATTYQRRRTRSDSNAVSSKVFHRIRDLEQHPAVFWDESSTFSSMHKKKLAKRHLPLFDRTTLQTTQLHEGGTEMDFEHDHLFDKFAQVVCNAGVVARKEVFETWASALYIHASFLLGGNSSKTKDSKSVRRVADIAAGHGLLAWALLVLDDEVQRQRNGKNERESGFSHDYRELTAFCLDVQMPQSAELIQAAMIEQWPNLESRFDYVEGRLEQLVPHHSCLLASVHACGSLSDVLVATAAKHAVPLAVIPCCHSRKRKVLESVASPYAKSEYDTILNHRGSMPDLADRLDGVRMIALENAGFDVFEFFIPDIFTGKNRLILGFPPSIPNPTEDDACQMPPLDDTPSMINPKARFMKGFYVPCEDSLVHLTKIKEISGKAAANNRKKVMHNRKHMENPQFDLSLWLPPQDLEVEPSMRMLTEESLSNLIVQLKTPGVEFLVSKLGEEYQHPKTGRNAQTFRIQYKGVESFDEAKAIHEEFYSIIPDFFPGSECR
ncbi:hypothetical protein ACHAXS_011787 [Conticribra weissflogii]